MTMAARVSRERRRGQIASVLTVLTGDYATVVNEWLRDPGCQRGRAPLSAPGIPGTAKT